VDREAFFRVRRGSPRGATPKSPGKFGTFSITERFFWVAFSEARSLIGAAFGDFSRDFLTAVGCLPHPALGILEEQVMAKKSGSKPMTKTEIMRSISETTNLAKKDVVAVLEALTTEIQKALKGSGIGVFSIPGLVKIERRKVPARPAQKGVKNPFTGELQDRPAKPASVKVRVRALKNLKAMVSP
jgi:nucleoid DNA-binding protein